MFGTGRTRWRNLTDAALGDGLLGAVLLARYEAILRPEDLRWTDWTTGQMSKIADAVDHFERRADELVGRVDIGTITLGCGLGYLDFRFPDYDWRSGHPRITAWFEHFTGRPSMSMTIPA